MVYVLWKLVTLALRLFEFHHKLPVRGDVFQERVLQRFVIDIRRALLQQMVRSVQDFLGTGIVRGFEDAIAGEVDAEGFERTVERAGFQVLEDGLHVGQGLR